MSPKTNSTLERRFQAELSARDAEILDSLKADLDIRSNAELLSEAVAIVRWLVRERRRGRVVASFTSDDRPLHELVSALLERAAPVHELPRVEMNWTREELARFAELAEVDPLANHVGEAVLKDFLLRADHYDSVVGHVVDFDCKRCKSILLSLCTKAPKEKQAVLSKRLAALGITKEEVPIA